MDEVLHLQEDAHTFCAAMVLANRFAAANFRAAGVHGFAYVHTVKTELMRKWVPYGTEGLFTLQELFDTCRLVFVHELKFTDDTFLSMFQADFEFVWQTMRDHADELVAAGEPLEHPRLVEAWNHALDLRPKHGTSWCCPRSDRCNGECPWPQLGREQCTILPGGKVVWLLLSGKYCRSGIAGRDGRGVAARGGRQSSRRDRAALGAGDPARDHPGVVLVGPRRADRRADGDHRVGRRLVLGIGVTLFVVGLLAAIGRSCSAASCTPSHAATWCHRPVSSRFSALLPWCWP